MNGWMDDNYQNQGQDVFHHRARFTSSLEVFKNVTDKNTLIARP